MVMNAVNLAQLVLMTTGYPLAVMSPNSVANHRTSLLRMNCQCLVEEVAQPHPSVPSVGAPIAPISLIIAHLRHQTLELKRHRSPNSRNSRLRRKQKWRLRKKSSSSRWAFNSQSSLNSRPSVTQKVLSQ